MNKQRRKLIEKAHASITDALAMLQQAAEEEREYFDNMPESLQGGEKGEKADGDAQVLEDACTEIEDQLGYVLELIQ